jgi:hypothetical protein
MIAFLCLKSYIYLTTKTLQLIQILNKVLEKKFNIKLNYGEIFRYKNCLKKILYCIGGGIPKDLLELNFISICSKKKLNNPVYIFSFL